MRITDLKTVLLTGPSTNDPYFRESREVRSAAFIEVLSEFMRVARLFENRGKKIATHAWGAGGSLMQNIHCAFASPNTCILEIPPALGPLHAQAVGDSLRMREGHMLPPDTPGSGIQLTDSIKERFPFVPESGGCNPVPGKGYMRVLPKAS